MTTLSRKLRQEQKVRELKEQVEAIVGQPLSNDDWISAGGGRSCDVKEVANRMLASLRDRRPPVVETRAEPPVLKVTASEKVACPYCGNKDSTVERTIGNQRYRQCRKGCGRNFRTTETAN